MRTQWMLKTACQRFSMLLLLLSWSAAANAEFSCFPTARQLSWSTNDFTVFFHFGVNTLSGLECGSGQENPKTFNPTALDAGQWVRSSKSAGASGMVLICKRDDGFCLWPSQFTDLDFQRAHNNRNRKLSYSK